MDVARVAFVTYAGTVEGFRRFGLPELRRAGMRGWTLALYADRIQDGLDRAEDAETAWSARCLPSGASVGRGTEMPAEEPGKVPAPRPRPSRHPYPHPIM